MRFYLKMQDVFIHGTSFRSHLQDGSRPLSLPAQRVEINHANDFNSTTV